MPATYEGPDFMNLQQEEEDKKLFVQFFFEAVQNQVKSDKEGRPIYDEVPMVRIMTPGSKDVMVTRASIVYQQRFPKQWERFNRAQEQVQDGTPLNMVPFLTVGIIAELKAVNCLTLEQLANLPDTAISKMMGMSGYRDRARAFLAAAKDAAPLTQLQAELEKRDREIDVLKGQVADLVKRLDSAHKEKAAVGA